MKEIVLSGKLTESLGLVALVDDADYERLNQHKWQALKGNKTYYAARTDCSGGKQRTVLMHRVLLGLTDPKVQGDHEDGNGLNNQHHNLRITAKQNQQNVGKRKDNISGFKGVSWDKRCDKYRVQIRDSGKKIHRGYFTDPILAASAYDAAARQYHGEFARLNFPTNNEQGAGQDFTELQAA